MEKLKQTITFVPWFNISEWFFVYELLYGENVDISAQKKALEILNMWKSRTSLLQSGVEGTLIILSSMHLENQNSYNSRLIKSTSIMRFLNICAAHDKKQGTFYYVAKKRKIPEWIISLRHEAAHSQQLPTEDILDKALTFCFQWLYENYWRPVSIQMKDYVPEYNIKNIEINELKSILQPYVINYVYINLSTHPHWGYIKFNDIVDKDLRESVMSNLQDLLPGEYINEDIKLSQVLNLLWKKIENILQSYNLKEKTLIVPELLIENGIIFCEIDEFNDIFGGSNPTKIPKQFLCLWENLLKNMHSCNMLTPLIERLINVINNKNSSHLRKNVSALWLDELGNALHKCIVAQNLYQKIPPEKRTKLSLKKLKLKLEDHCKITNPEYENVLTLNVLAEIPEFLTKGHLFKEKLLRHPNKYTLIFLKTFLNICNDFKEDIIKNQIIRLTELYINSNNDKRSESYVYQVEDVKSILGSDDQIFSNNDINGFDIKSIGNTDNNETWKTVTDIDFEGCPIGILPWQVLTKNPLVNIL